MNQLVKFQEQSLEMLTVNGRPALTAEAVGTALGYAEPRKSINNLFNAHRNEFKDGIHQGVLKTMTPGGIQDLTVFFSQGVILLCFFSNQPLAADFRQWAAEVLSAELTGESAQKEIAELERQIAQMKYERYFLEYRGARLRKIERATQLYELRILTVEEIARAVPVDLGLLKTLIALRERSLKNFPKMQLPDTRFFRSLAKHKIPKRFLDQL